MYSNSTQVQKGRAEQSPKGATVNPTIDPMPLSSRMSWLLETTRVDLAEGIAPLSERFLSEHEITPDEAESLREHLQHAITAYRRVPAQNVLTAMGEELAMEAEASLVEDAEKAP
jgi:hypothetical protein